MTTVFTIHDGESIHCCRDHCDVVCRRLSRVRVPTFRMVAAAACVKQFFSVSKLIISWVSFSHIRATRPQEFRAADVKAFVMAKGKWQHSQVCSVPYLYEQFTDSCFDLVKVDKMRPAGEFKRRLRVGLPPAGCITCAGYSCVWVMEAGVQTAPCVWLREGRWIKSGREIGFRPIENLNWLLVFLFLLFACYFLLRILWETEI